MNEYPNDYFNGTSGDQPDTSRDDTSSQTSYPLPESFRPEVFDFSPAPQPEADGPANENRPTDASAPAEEQLRASDGATYGDGPAAQPQQTYGHGVPYERQQVQTGQYRQVPDVQSGSDGVPPYAPPQHTYPYYGSDAQGPQRNQNPYSSQYSYPYRNTQQTTDPSGNGSKNRGGVIFIAVLALILVGVLAALGSAWLNMAKKTVAASDTTAAPTAAERVAEPIKNVDKATTEASPQSEQNPEINPEAPAAIYKKILPSSVGILVYANNSKSLSSEGSGVIFTEDKDGKYTYIITCAHVISGKSQSLVVQLYDEKEYAAEVVGYDLRTDIGVVRIEANGLQAMKMGDSTSLSVGDTVYAIGNPGGTEFANTFTNGIVTALARPVSSSTSGYTMECIQHNAAINPGNSGGALVNEYGQLIGINSMKIIASDYEGMGFAVPSSVFVDVVNSIIENGYVANRPKIGISYLKSTAEQAYAMFVAIKGLPGGSIIVAEIAEDSDFAGKLKKGDLITAINGQDLNTTANVAAQIEGMNVGDSITLHVVRIKPDYSYDEFDFTGVLVEDKATDILNQEESTDSGFDDYFGGYMEP